MILKSTVYQIYIYTSEWLMMKYCITGSYLYRLKQLVVETWPGACMFEWAFTMPKPENSLQKFLLNSFWARNHEFLGIISWRPHLVVTNGDPLWFHLFIMPPILWVWHMGLGKKQVSTRGFLQKRGVNLSSKSLPVEEYPLPRETPVNPSFWSAQ